MRDIPSLLSYWREKYQCTDEQENAGANATHVVYGGCAQNARVEHYRIGGADHGWPSQINGTSTHQVMWNFLSEFRMDRGGAPETSTP